MKLLLSLLGICFLVFNSYCSELTDSLERSLKKTSNGIEKLKLMQRLGDEYFYEDIDRLKPLAERFLQLSQELDQPLYETAALIELGNYYYGKGSYKEALKLYFQSAGVQKKHGLHEKLGDTYASIGNVYESMGETKKALHNYLVALRYDERSGDLGKLSDDYTNLGIFYQHIDQPQTTLKYYRKALALDLKIGDKRRLSSTYGNFGSLYYQLQDIDSSVYYHEKALVFAEKVNFEEQIGRITNNLGNLYFEAGEYDRALNSFLRSKAIKEASGNLEGLTTAYLNLASVYRVRKDYTEAIASAKHSWDLSEEIKFPDGQADAAELLSEIYNELGDYQNGYKYYKESADLRRKLVNDESVKQVAEMQTRYDTEKKSQQIILLRNQKKFQRNMLVLSILLIIAIFGMLYMRYRQKQKRLLAQQLMEEQTLRYSSVIEAQEQEKMRIARDLHDGVCQKFAATKMQFSTLSDAIVTSIPDKTKSYAECIRMLDEATSELRSVAHEIMPPALRQHDLLKALEQLASETFGNVMGYTFETFGNAANPGASIEMNVYRIAQELFSNVIRHSDATEVAVQFLANNQRISLMVEDNGKGIESGKISGVGLDNIQLRAKLLNAQFNLEPGVNGGTIASLSIPVNKEETAAI